MEKTERGREGDREKGKQTQTNHKGFGRETQGRAGANSEAKEKDKECREVKLQFKD